MTKRFAAQLLNYPADYAWAYAVEAYQINGGYFKRPEWDWVNEELVQTRAANREIVVARLKSEEQPNNELLAAGRDYREFWQSQMLLLLNDRANDFVKSVIVVAEKDTVESELELSIIVSCIETADKQRKQQAIEDRKYSLSSSWRYSVDSAVEFHNNVEVIRCQYIDKAGAHAIDSIIDGDLYFWWSKNFLEVKNYRYLRGRVKNTSVDFATKVPVTQLNYVKVL